MKISIIVLHTISLSDMSYKACDSCNGTGKIPVAVPSKNCSGCGSDNIVEHCKGWGKSQCEVNISKGFCYPCLKKGLIKQDGLCVSCSKYAKLSCSR